MNAQASISSRNAHLDLLRAIACTAVVLYHIDEMAPLPMPHFRLFAQWGCYGVDLFFVLSGWLIGGLYWRELQRFGNINLSRFLPRRWIRTIPPYLAALALAWGAVWWERKEPFDFGYLAFIQNYYDVIPFFLVSWSLCVEEHFYLFMPLLLLGARKMKLSPHWLFAILVIIPLPARLLASRNGLPTQMGFELAATHLRMEGLILGFWAASLPLYSPMVWQALQKRWKQILITGLVALAVLPLLSEAAMYKIGFSILAIAFTAILIAIVEQPAGRWVRSSAVKWLALTSYSVYLTHVLMLHLAQHLPQAAFIPVGLAASAIGGSLFYICFERLSLVVREHFAPRRAAE